MNTQFALLARYETPVIALRDVCEEFFGIAIKTAEAQSKAGTFPVPTFKLRDSNQSPTLIHINDLAEHIDLRLKNARDEFNKINS